MDRESSLVRSLVSRLETKLPHRTGSDASDIHQDELAVLTRATLIRISSSGIEPVIEALLSLLEEITPFDKPISAHPLHVLHSELYVLDLITDCCSACWDGEVDAVNVTSNLPIPLDAQVSAPYVTPGHRADGKGGQIKKDTRSLLALRLGTVPKPLSAGIVARIIETVGFFLIPLPEDYVLDTSKILDDGHGSASLTNSIFMRRGTDRLSEQQCQPESYARMIIEFISASNWSYMFNFVQSTLRSLRSAHPPQSSANSADSVEEEHKSLIALRMIADLWVDGAKLKLILAEICGSFLHLRRPYQNTVAIVLPMLINRWIDNSPKEFINLHTTEKRLDGGADTLFDMTISMIDAGRKKAIVWPFQTALLFVNFEVWEVASHLKERTGSISKKAAFLKDLLKTLRSSRSVPLREAAAYCLINIMRVSRHFPPDSESALMSYALDIHDEIREAIFRRTEIPSFDRTLLTAAFVTLTELDCEETLIAQCLEAGSPTDFKISFFSGAAHLAIQERPDRFSALFTRVAPFVRAQLKNATPVPKQFHANGYSSRKTSGDQPQSDLIYSILTFLSFRPLVLFEAAATPDSPGYNEFFEETLRSFVGCLGSDDELIRSLASNVTRRLLADNSVVLLHRNLKSGSQAFPTSFWRTTSTILYTLCNKAVQLGLAGPGRKSLLNLIHDYLEARYALLKTDEEVQSATAIGSEVVPDIKSTSEALEVVVLVFSCSADLEICSIVTRILAIFCDEAKLITATAPESAKSTLTILKNLEVYQEMSSKTFRFTGLVAFQKIFRKRLLSRLNHPTAGILSAWETVFSKWIIFSKQLSSSRPLEERSLVEWRNYSGFLASLGGCCIAEQASQAVEDSYAGLRWIDRHAPDRSREDTLLDLYLSQSIRLLTCSIIRVREATRESLAEISPSLYPQLFKALQDELEDFFDNPRPPAPASSDPRIIFAEQAAALLKTVVERLGNLTEIGAAIPLDAGELTLSFAKFLDFAESKESILVKIKICQLCEVVTRKKELLNLRHDVRIRNALLEILFNWITRPGSPGSDNNAAFGGSRVDEILRLQKDLDKACLKALTHLTYRLPLQPLSPDNETETGDLRMEMFHSYFNRFLALLSFDSTESGKRDAQSIAAREDSVPTIEFAITALSNLLSANIDIGLKNSLSLGYHEDLGIRIAFVRVLCNVLRQGTELNNLSDAAINEKYDELLELLLNDMVLTIAICDACPSTEIDEMTVSLLNIFESRGLGFMLLKALIDHEVETTENESELLRRNCVATKILAVYAKWKGSSYLRSTLQKVLERLILSSNDVDLELDPARVATPEELEKNALQLRIVTKVFVDDICNSTPNMPVSFRQICHIICTSVMVRFPEAKYTAVGAFIFLRFFCPAIVAPDAEGIVASIPSKEMRRGLLLIAKVVQNLANNVLFGAKEPYMFPLNDFLTSNIIRVTTFLRDVSAPPTRTETIGETESFDFGSCVTLHRYLYEHWDQVRQKLVTEGRKAAVQSPSDTKGRLPVLETLRRLVSNLGPPPMDVSWNRPMISANNPPLYSRFQHFMLRNAGRSTESIMSSRAIYDGGETKDGLSVICIILRNIDTEETDYDLLLYCYLKIASRMWHKPFGILIDATCYNGQNEPQDALFRKLDLLTPSELSKQLTRVYVYNMNSVFRKCFRRILRLSAKSDTSAFHKNVEYHLAGSLADLQLHFHLSQIQLPKETISAVMDTTITFQPITRLSRTKGDIEVTLKIGNRYVQVTTTHKQEVMSGMRLNAVINDIFRLTEIDEANTSVQTEDDSAFGIRTHNGKIVMYFTSPRKADVLQAIRAAKAKHGKDLTAPKSFERLLKPQDIPGTLLNLSLANMTSMNSTLRLAAYNLLCALCRAFKFGGDASFLSCQELFIPLHPSQYVVDVSRQLAASEPQLTLDFLNEFVAGWDSFPWQQRPLSLRYVAPWLPCLRSYVLSSDADSDKAREKVASLVRRLIDIAVSDLSLSTTFEEYVWPMICQDELHTEILMDELVKTARAYSLDDDHTEALGSIIASLRTVTIRGKLLSRLRKALNRSSVRPTKHISDNVVWTEICVLVRLCLSTSFGSGVQSQLYLPELFHVVTMLANSGPPDARQNIHRLLVNTVHAICTTFSLEEAKLTRLTVIAASIAEPRSDLFYSATGNIRDGGSITLSLSQESGNSALAATESIAFLLSEISLIAAPTVDTSNAWRSRWMSLVASTAFQSNPAIQPRAFTVMGCLAREDVDDDLLYQVLVALRNSINRFMEENDSEMLIAIVTSLTKMMDKLRTASRYGLQLFWLALSLVRLVPISLYNCTALFLEAVLNNISTSGDFNNAQMVSVLLAGRVPLQRAALELDEIYGIHFSEENFHMAICSCLAKGLAESVTKATALRVFSTFLETASSCLTEEQRFPSDFSLFPYLGIILARVTSEEEAKEVLWLAGTTVTGSCSPTDILSMIDFDSIGDQQLLLNAVLSIVDFHYLEDSVQHRILLWLHRLTLLKPAVLAHLYASLITILDDILQSCQNAATLESAHDLLRVVTCDPGLSNVEPTETLDDVLEEIGFGGLLRSSSFVTSNDHDRQCAILTDKLIEHIIV